MSSSTFTWGFRGGLELSLGGQVGPLLGQEGSLVILVFDALMVSLFYSLVNHVDWELMHAFGTSFPGHKCSSHIPDHQ